MIDILRKVIFKRSALPLSLTYFVTNKCNLFCKHCFYRESLNQASSELSLSEIDRLSSSLKGLTVLVISGGEPFLRQEFAEIVRILLKNTSLLKLIIASNGSFTEKIVKDSEEILKSSKKTHITFHFSVDGIKQDQDNFRGMDGLFERLTGTIEGMKKLKKYYSNFEIGVLLTVNPVNQEKVLDIYRYIRDYLKPDVISPIFMRAPSGKLDSKDVKIRYYEDLAELIKKDVDSNRIKGHSNFPFSKIARDVIYLRHKYIAETTKRNRFIIPCFAGALSGVIYEDGRVAPCEILDYSFGNIRDFNYDFKKLWLGQRARDVKNKIRQIKCFCTYECAMDVNIAFNLKILFPLFLKKFTHMNRGS
jgi:MoaA/NifB/PqqE/SkfB family radical SAM enzyme